MPQNKSHQVRIRWQHLSVFCTKQQSSDSAIVKYLSGQVNSGQLLVIMGPSGAGKSTLLDTITGRMTKGMTMQGSILLNDEPLTRSSFSKIGAYVQQQDILMPTLTVYETIQFQARLKLPNATEQQQHQRVLEVLRKVNLIQCRDIPVGGSSFGLEGKTISGGQRKRLSIAVELLSNPACIVLDEPTSGLDSQNAAKLISLLKQLASSENKLIIATVHQPSSRMFAQFDRLYLLKKSQLVYSGQASRIVNYMESIGIKVNYKMNPADFFMLQMSEMHEKSVQTTLLTAYNWRKKIQQTSGALSQGIINSYHSGSLSVGKQGQNQIIHPNNESVRQEIKQSNDLKFGYQMGPLLVRSWRNMIRAPSNQLGKLISVILVPFLLGTLYFGIGSRLKQVSDEQQLSSFLQQLSSCIFISMFFGLGLTLYDTILIFPNQKILVLRQISSGLYSLKWYYASKLLIELPGNTIPTIISSSALYLILDMPRVGITYLAFIVGFILQNWAGYVLGMGLGACFDSPAVAIQVLPLIMVPFTIFGGLVINLSTLSPWISWMQYLASIRHSYNAVLIALLNTDQMFRIGEIPVICDSIGIGYTTSDIWISFGFLIGLIFLMVAATIIGLIIIRRSL